MKKIYIFDVDGVLNSPDNKTSIDPSLLKTITHLTESEYTAIATGRDYEWLTSFILTPLKAHLSSRSTLSHFLITAEFGEVTVSFVDGQEIMRINKEHMLPENIHKKLEEIAKNQFSHIENPLKTITMYGSEAFPNISLEEYRSHQKAMKESYLKLIREHNLEKTFTVHADLIGNNVRHKLTTKRNCVKSIQQWLNDTQVTISHYTVFGDSTSDLEMGRELYDQGCSFTYVHTGEKEIVTTADLSFSVTFPTMRYDKGTLEYLQHSLSQND